MKRAREDDEYDDFCSNLPVGSSPSPRHRVKRPKINPNYESMKYHYGLTTVQYKSISSSSPEYQNIKNLIDYKAMVIDDLVEVSNPVLETAYELKKCEKKFSFGEVSECLLFHGTKSANVGSICTYNFDWRLFGSNRGHKFGKGVNFSPSAKYASNYSDPKNYMKVMIVAKVLMAKICQGHHDMSLPPPGYDTSQKDDNASVIVKFEDNEFYPAYILHYHLLDKAKNKNIHHNDYYYKNRYYIDRRYNSRRYNKERSHYRDRYGYYRYNKDYNNNYYYNDRNDGYNGNARYF